MHYFTKVGALAAALALPTAAFSSIITDGNITLGVKETGALNVPGGDPSPVTRTTSVGLRYNPTGYEATAHGCSCEGWGVGIADGAGSAVASGWDANGFSNLTVDEFSADATTAKSVVSLTSGELRVTHGFALADETDNLYRVTVEIENTSGAFIEDLRYTRLMDWDIEPTTFSEVVTIQGTEDAANVLFAHDDGFESGNPFAARSPRVAGSVGDFVDSGPADHGALFDFGFGELGIGETFSFDIFYGAAETESAALNALGEVGAEVFSFGQPSSDPDGTGMGAGLDTNVFIFGFSGVGGSAVPDPTPDPDPMPMPMPAVPLPASSLLLLGGLGLLGAGRQLKKRKS